MNDILQNIMIFINEHTLLLIGICVFLILVLIGYLIDNSVKSKRIRKDIKNASQVPDNIKDEIIKEANKEKEVQLQENTEQPVIENKDVNVDNITVSIENSNLNDLSDNNTNTISQSVENTSEIDGQQNELNTPLDLENDITLDLNNMPLEAENLTAPLNINISLDETPKSDSDIIPQDILVDTVPQPNIDLDTDPDADIMKDISTKLNEYTNDKKLSEILMESNRKEMKIDDSNIFTSNEPNISFNNEVKKDDVQIESNTDSQDDELDRIMRKLSSMNNNTEEDNYTNIF